MTSSKYRENSSFTFAQLVMHQPIKVMGSNPGEWYSDTVMHAFNVTLDINAYM